MSVRYHRLTECFPWEFPRFCKNLTLALEQQECEEEERWVVEERRVAEEKAKKEAECQGDSRSCTAIDKQADKVKSSRRS